MIVMVLWSCGSRRACIEGRENACEVNGSRTTFPTTPGLGPDGAMAEYMLVKARYLEKLGDLDPATAAPLAVGRTALEELHFHRQSGLSHGHLAGSSSAHWRTASAEDRPDIANFRDGARSLSIGLTPVCDDRLSGTGSLSDCTHPPRHLQRQ